MSILKIRDENGNIHSIATMKGDKGDGVPDGGSAGQVIKKTADGTEWGDTGVPDGGVAGQVLKKTADGTAWGDIAEIPKGGNAGQVVKKTEEGVGWGDVTSACTAIFTNTDIAVNSYTITKRGLYEVKIFCALSQESYPAAAHYNKACKCLMSISDLNETQEQRLVIGSYTQGSIPHDLAATIKYESGTFSSHYNHVYVSGSSVMYPSGEHSYLAEVRLIIPYN